MRLEGEVVDIARITSTVRCDIVRGRTGREIANAGLDQVPEIEAWLALDGHAFRAHRCYEDFLEDAQKCQFKPGTGDLTLYRGRDFPRGHTPQSKEFGPPPANKSPANRYNEAGEPALYLANTRDGVRRELVRGSIPSPRPWVQEFKVPWSQLVWLDSRSQISDEANSVHLLPAVFDVCEHGSDPEYAASRKIAALIRERNFDGLIVPGVQGTRGHHYFNVVVFVIANWQQWLAPKPPYLMNIDPNPYD